MTEFICWTSILPVGTPCPFDTDGAWTQENAMRGAVANPNTVMMSEKGIDGITLDNDFINKLLCPESRGEGPNKKGPAKAFLTQLAHKAETR